MPVEPVSDPVFVVGLPRSGTTLLQSILVNTGQFESLPETHFYSYLTRGLAFPLNDASHVSLEHRHQVKMKEAFPLNREYRPKGKTELFIAYIETFRQQAERRLLEKTPRHIFHLQELFEAMPSAKVIVLIREPKNAISSLLCMEPGKHKTVTRFCRLYNRVLAAVYQWRWHARVKVVRYEDMLDKPNEIFSQIFAFLNLDINLPVSARAPEGVIRSSEAWKRNNLELADVQPNSPEAWSGRISERDAKLVEFLCAACFEEGLYVPAFPPSSVGKGLSLMFGDLWQRRGFKEWHKTLFNP